MPHYHELHQHLSETPEPCPGDHRPETALRRNEEKGQAPDEDRRPIPGQEVGTSIANPRPK